MIFKLAQAAEKSWHRLRGHDQLPKVILGVKFKDGIVVVRSQAQTAAAWPHSSPRFGNNSLAGPAIPIEDASADAGAHPLIESWLEKAQQSGPKNGSGSSNVRLQPLLDKN
jgi:hypothetical protein